METWRLIEDGALGGRLNMATDRAILTACGEGKAPPTLRLYSWAEPTLTVGYTQNSPMMNSPAAIAAMPEGRGGADDGSFLLELFSRGFFCSVAAIWMDDRKIVAEKDVR